MSFNKVRLMQPAKVRTHRRPKGHSPYADEPIRIVTPRKNQISQVEIDFCVENCPNAKCNGERCKALKEYLRGIEK